MLALEFWESPRLRCLIKDGLVSTSENTSLVLVLDLLLLLLFHNLLVFQSLVFFC